MNEHRYWRLAGILGIIGAVALASFIINWYIKRPTTDSGAAISGKTFEASAASQQELKTFIDKETRINGVAVVSSDLIKNIRRITFFYADNADLQKVWNEYLTRRVKGPTPVFANDSVLYNERTANIINGGFDCRAFNTTIGFTFYPDAEKTSPVVCAISIPSSFDKSGDFVGYLNFFMSGFPIDSEKKRLAADMTVLSSAIYARDVLEKK